MAKELKDQSKIFQRLCVEGRGSGRRVARPCKAWRSSGLGRGSRWRLFGQAGGLESEPKGEPMKR